MQRHSYILFLALSILWSGCATKNDDSTGSSNEVDSGRGPDDTAGLGGRALILRIDSLLLLEDTVAVSKLLASNEIDINQQSEWYGTLLNKFVDHNSSVRIVSFLLSKGADPNVINHLEESGWPHERPTTTCDPAIGRLLIKHGSKYQLDAMVSCAAHNKDKKGVVAAIAAGGDPSSALDFAYQYDPLFFDSLVRAGADKTRALTTVCHVKSITQPGRYEMDTVRVRKLVEIGGDPSVDAIGSAIFYRHRYLTDFLLKRGAKKNTALYAACEAQDTVLIRRLVRDGARLVQLVGEFAFSDNEVLKELVAPVTDGKGFSHVTEDLEGTFPSALQRACSEGNLSAVRFMLRTGADPNEYCGDCAQYQEECGCEVVSALGLAMARDNDEMVQLLKKYKAKVPGECE